MAKPKRHLNATLNGSRRKPASAWLLASRQRRHERTSGIPPGARRLAHRGHHRGALDAVPDRRLLPPGRRRRDPGRLGADPRGDRARPAVTTPTIALEPLGDRLPKPLDRDAVQQVTLFPRVRRVRACVRGVPGRPNPPAKTPGSQPRRRRRALTDAFLERIAEQYKGLERRRRDRRLRARGGPRGEQVDGEPLGAGRPRPRRPARARDRAARARGAGETGEREPSSATASSACGALATTPTLERGGPPPAGSRTAGDPVVGGRGVAAKPLVNAHRRGPLGVELEVGETQRRSRQRDRDHTRP